MPDNYTTVPQSRNRMVSIETGRPCTPVRIQLTTKAYEPTPMSPAELAEVLAALYPSNPR